MTMEPFSTSQPFRIDMPPGSVIVVGPNGRLVIEADHLGQVQVIAQNCDFIGDRDPSPAHRALVDERWALRTETGAFFRPDSLVELPDWFARKSVAAPPPPPPPPPPPRSSKTASVTRAHRRPRLISGRPASKTKTPWSPAKVALAAAVRSRSAEEMTM